MAPPKFQTPPKPGSKSSGGGSSSRVKSKARIKTVHHTEDDGEGNWLVSYADMMTLLMGFFVMLTAFSVPDAGKMESLKKETAEAMGGKYTKPFEELSGSIEDTLPKIDLNTEVSVAETDEGVTIVSKGTLFFDSGKAVLKPKARNLMDNIANILAKQAKSFRIIVEGHTDDSPIHSREFPSNWELSSTRAGTVVRLLESKGIARKNLRPVGLADTEPISPNRDDQGQPIPTNRAENRRIVIRVQKQLPNRMGKKSKNPKQKLDKKAPAPKTATSTR